MTRVETLHCFIEWFAYDPRMGLKKDHLNICMATPVLNSSPKVTLAGDLWFSGHESLHTCLWSSKMGRVNEIPQQILDYNEARG